VVDAEQALLVLSIPPDFAARLSAGQAAPLQVILDGRNSSTAGSAAGHVAAIVAAYNASLATPGAQGPPGIRVERRAWFNPNLESRWNMMPGLIAALSMLQTLLLAELSVAREREQGTFDQLLVTPLTPMQILIGKALPSILIGLLQSTIIFLIIRFWFEIPMQGSVGLLYFGLVVFTVASVGVGLSISALSLTMQQAMLYTFLLIMPLMLLSGLFTPVRNMPEVLQLATYANPLRFGMDIVRRVYLEGAGFIDIWRQFIPLLVLAATTLPLFFAGAALCVFATTAMGIFMATVARNMPQFGMLMILIILPLQMLSGGSSPRESMPELVQDIMLLAPTTHFVKLGQAILFRGAGLDVVWPQFVALLLIGGVLFALSLQRFRRTIAQMA